ncbi:MAG: hypothetical protein RMA76_16415 [Deltaproteobacteria bacterium]
MRSFARVLALVFHPVVPGFFVALYAAIEHEGGLTARLWSIAALVTGVCVVLPLATTGLAFRLGWLGDDLYLVRRENRRFLYPVAAISLAVAAAIFTWVYPFPLATAMCWAALGVTLALFAFNRTVKPSIHCAGLMGVATSATWVYGLTAAPLFVLVPIVAWARVRTENHTPLETLLGSAIGGVMTALACVALVP